MNYSNFLAAVSLKQAGRNGKRRPTGMSRREKRRMLNFETLEDRRVMSVNPLNVGDGCRADEYVSQTQRVELSDADVRDVLLDSRTLGAFADAAELSQYTDQQLTSTKEWVVFAAKGVASEQITDATGVNIAGETGIVPWSYIVDTSDGNYDQLIHALTNTDLVDYFYPLVPFDLDSHGTTNDEFLEKQWYLVNFGQDTGNPDFSPILGKVDEDINIEGAWDTVTGKGVQIGIVDQGIFVGSGAHPDLAANIRADLAIDLVDGDSNPGPATTFDAHGTAVAGIAAGVGNNGIGITGVAYEAEIAPIRLFGSDLLTLTDHAISQAFTHESQIIDVYNHSWGITPPVDDQGTVTNLRAITKLGPLATSALRNSVFFGRGGLGGIHVFAAGNSIGDNDSGNFAETVNSRYTISVTSVIESGGPTSYAEAGAAVLVAAPSGSNPLTIIRDDELGSGIYTTDLLGDDGYNEAPVFGIEIDADYQENTDYSSRFNGTSASAPIVSGVIALMLEANPNLTYRDVQHILVRSSRQNLASDPSWITNNQQLFNDPLAFDSDGHLPLEEQDGSFDGAWPVGSAITPGDPEADPVVPDIPNTQVYYAEPTLPFQFTNGAGLTVSQLTETTDSGFAHGVVDATLAVELARNWVTLGGQTSEFTWSPGSLLHGQINASAVSSDDTGRYRIPGGVVGTDGNVDEPNAFIDFFDEFAEEVTPGDPGDPSVDPPVEPTDPEGPFVGDDPPVNTRGSYIPLSPPSMSVEWVEVELDLIAPDANDFDLLRIVLVSPDGTQSELKSFHNPDVEHPIFHRVGFSNANDPAGNITNDEGRLQAVFTTNRHWGERTEAKVRLNTDGTPVRGHAFFDADPDDGIDALLANKTIDSNPNPGGQPIVDGWKLVFENFGESVIDINTYTVAFHGINSAGTGRIQGLVGVDDNADGFFSSPEFNPDDPAALPPVDNFTRYSEINLLDQFLGADPLDPDDDVTPDDGFYPFIASSDPYISRTSLGAVQESWAAGAIVYVDLDHNGTRDFTDPHYQIGADGNYFFDLPASAEGEQYDIRLDPNSLDAAGLLNSQNQAIANDGPFAHVTIASTGERVTGFSVVNPDDGTQSLLNSTSVKELNLKLVANTQPENIVNLSGVVYADLNNNGVNDGDDAPIAGANVFIDVNQNGVFAPGFDVFTTSEADGSYSFPEDLPVAPGFYSVIVLNGTTGTFNTPVVPGDAEHAFFFAPELTRTDLDFGFEIGPGGGGGGGGPVAISGVVFEDANNNGQRGSFETGLAGIATVYLDLNDNNVRDDIEPTTTTGNNGSFVFNSLLAGVYSVRIDFDTDQYEQTTPTGDLDPVTGARLNEDQFETRITVAAGTAATGIDFGLHNRAVADFGDLPSAFPIASHIKFGDLYLGSSVDAELTAHPSDDAKGDDDSGNGLGDEDGVVFGQLLNNSTALTVTVTANTNGGFLQGWIDFNQDFAFQASELVIPEILLNQGETDFVISVPAGLTDGVVYARFRYGEDDISGFSGHALKGEVEDYAIPVGTIDPGLVVISIGDPDFDSDGDIDGSDFLAWQRGLGTNNATPAHGDANGDGNVNGGDLHIFDQQYGLGAFSTSATGDFDSDGDADGTDFLAWQRGVGQVASLSTGDGNQDGTVDGADLQAWENSYDAGSSSAALAAVQSPPSISDLLAAYSTPAGSSSTAASYSYTLGPVVSQPGFREDFVAGVVDTTIVETTESTVAVDRVNLASLASEFDRQSTRGQFAAPVRRAGYRLDEAQPALAAERAELGLALRDRVWEEISTKRQSVVEETEQFDAEEALAEAFGEEINWRL